MAKINPELLSKPFSELTEEEMDQVMTWKQAEKEKEKRKRRQEHVKNRELLIKTQIQKAKKLSEAIKEFKDDEFERFENFYQQMMELAELSPDNKGSFSIKSEDSLYKIEYSNQIVKEFDETAETAAMIMEEYIEEEFLKKGNKQAYEYIKAAMTRRGKDQKLDVNLINRLEPLAKQYPHPKFIKALEGFKEAYREVSTSSYIRHYERNASTGQYELIGLNFASI